LDRRVTRSVWCDSITQQLEGLPTVKKAKIQFTIEKAEEEVEEVRRLRHQPFRMMMWRCLICLVPMSSVSVMVQDTLDSKMAFDKSDKKIKMSKVRRGGLELIMIYIG
jgi:hypothetical protein